MFYNGDDVSFGITPQLLKDTQGSGHLALHSVITLSEEVRWDHMLCQGLNLGRLYAKQVFYPLYNLSLWLLE